MIGVYKYAQPRNWITVESGQKVSMTEETGMGWEVDIPRVAATWKL